MSYFRAFLNSPVGPKTTHFWGPMANWGFVISGVMDSQKPPDAISGNMTSGEIVVVFTFLVQTTRTMVDVSFLNAKENVSSRNNGGSSISLLCVYSLLCMRFAWMVRPRNYLLLACHASNESVQLYQLSRWLKHQRYVSQFTSA
uniref:Mitochondrial pyruvate carrier n=1 Tax=Solanum tuberosum TaxID=4113 RepID=M1CKD0_SOLTU